MFDSASFDTGSISPLSFEFGVQVEQEPQAAPPGKSRKVFRRDEYDDWFNIQREALQEAVEARREETKPKTLRLVKKPVQANTEALAGISSEEIDQIAAIEAYIDRQLAIEYTLRHLAKRRRDNEALALLLLS